jgi:hypothetical protein
MTKKKTTVEFSDGEIAEMVGDIRDRALDQMAKTLKGFGISEADIATARAECIKLNSDKPFLELFKKSPFRGMFR